MEDENSKSKWRILNVVPMVDGCGNVVLGALFSLIMRHYDNDPFISVVITYTVGIAFTAVFNR